MVTSQPLPMRVPGAEYAFMHAPETLPVEIENPGLEIPTIANRISEDFAQHTLDYKHHIKSYRSVPEDCGHHQPRCLWVHGRG